MYAKTTLYKNIQGMHDLSKPLDTVMDHLIYGSFWRTRLIFTGYCIINGPLQGAVAWTNHAYPVYFYTGLFWHMWWWCSYDAYRVQISLLWFVPIHGVRNDLYAQFFAHPYMGRCHTTYNIKNTFVCCENFMAMASFTSTLWEQKINCHFWLKHHCNGELGGNALQVKKNCWLLWLFHWLSKMITAPI